MEAPNILILITISENASSIRCIGLPGIVAMPANPGRFSTAKSSGFKRGTA